MYKWFPTRLSFDATGQPWHFLSNNAGTHAIKWYRMGAVLSFHERKADFSGHIANELRRVKDGFCGARYRRVDALNLPLASARAHAMDWDQRDRELPIRFQRRGGRLFLDSDSDFSTLELSPHFGDRSNGPVSRSGLYRASLSEDRTIESYPERRVQRSRELILDAHGAPAHSLQADDWHALDGFSLIIDGHRVWVDGAFEAMGVRPTSDSLSMRAIAAARFLLALYGIDNGGLIEISNDLEDEDFKKYAASEISRTSSDDLSNIWTDFLKEHDGFEIRFSRALQAEPLARILFSLEREPGLELQSLQVLLNQSSQGSAQALASSAFTAFYVSSNRHFEPI